MSNSMLNIYVRVIKKRLEEGEELDTVLASYQKLTSTEIEEIKQRLQ